METVPPECFPGTTEAKPGLIRREIAPRDANTVRELAQSITGQVRSPLDPRLPALAESLLAAVPSSVRALLRPPVGRSGAAMISGLIVCDEELGPTPPDWQRAGIHELDITMLLLARCAGIPFGWQGQQQGRLVNNIVPARGHEDEQTGASSTVLLAPHTEDAFHPARANLLLLGCLRNPDRIGTTVSSVRNACLTGRQQRVLSTPAAPILPDVSYTDGADTCDAPLVATLWDNPDEGRTVRYDPAYTPLVDADAEFRAAYAALGVELERASMTVALAPGEVLLLDNDVAVHGRVPFAARYDGTDRWLKRVNIRLASRRRHPAEASESGYGQVTVDPFAGTDRGV